MMTSATAPATQTASAATTTEPMIPILDLTRQYTLLKPDIDAAVLNVMASGGFILGPTVQQFETEMAQYLNSPFAMGVASGTDALYLALRALNIGPGDEVITTAFTYIATSESITRAGAKPVFVDIDPVTMNMDVALIESVITSKTKAIMPVHLYGQPVDMDALMAIAQRHNLKVIEDCAQAIGAQWNGKMVGTIGDVGCFSFFPSKNLGAFGDGGLVCANDKAVADNIKMLRVHGSKVRYHHEQEGINSRLDAMQAAILSVKLPYLEGWIQRRQAIANTYTQQLKDCPGVVVPALTPGGRHVFHQYTLQVPNRDAMQAKLQAMGIQTMIYYPIPCHLQGMHQDLGHKAGDLPITERLCAGVLSLPIFPEMTQDEQTRVIESLKAAL